MAEKAPDSRGSRHVWQAAAIVLCMAVPFMIMNVCGVFTTGSRDSVTSLTAYTLALTAPIVGPGAAMLSPEIGPKSVFPVLAGVVMLAAVVLSVAQAKRDRRSGFALLVVTMLMWIGTGEVIFFVTVFGGV